MLVALAAWASVSETVLMVSWNTLDKRFDDLETGQSKRFGEEYTGCSQLRRRGVSSLPGPYGTWMCRPG